MKLRILIIPAAFAAILAAGVPVAVDYIAKSGRLANIINSAAAGDVHVSYSSCSGSILSKLRFEDLSVEGQDSNVIWKIKIKDATLSPSLLKLPRKSFSTSTLIGKGFSFNLQFKEKKKDEPDSPDGYKDNWRIELGDIDLSDISRIEVGTFKLEDLAKGTLRSSFYFWPEYEMEIGQTQFGAQNKDLKVDLEARLDRVRFRDAPGLGLFRSFSGTLSANGETDDLSFLDYYFKAMPWLKIGGKRGRLASFVKISNGVVEPQSHAKVEVQGLYLRTGLLTARGVGSVQLEGPLLSLHLTDYQMSPAVIRGKEIELHAESSKIDLADLGAHVEKINLNAGRVASRLAGNRAEMDLRVAARFNAIAPKVGSVNVSSVKVMLDRLRLAGEAHRGATQVYDWSGVISFEDGKIESDGSTTIKGKLHADARDGKPFLLALYNSKLVPFDFTTLSSVKDLTADATLDVMPGSVSFKDFRLKSDSLEAQGDLEVKDGQKSGKIRIKHPLKTLDIAFTPKK